MDAEERSGGRGGRGGDGEAVEGVRGGDHRGPEAVGQTVSGESGQGEERDGPKGFVADWVGLRVGRNGSGESCSVD